jgi:hypothetical protein
LFQSDASITGFFILARLRRGAYTVAH